MPHTVKQASRIFIFDKQTIKKNLVSLLLLLVYFFTMHSYTVYSSPMLAPTLEEAVNCKTIVVAEYIGFENKPGIKYFGGAKVKAFYRVTEIIKGQSIEEYIKLRYDFSDGSACLPPEDWKFTSKMMPKKGSLWVLFLKGIDDNGRYETYRGDYGRWQANEKNIRDVKSAVTAKYGSLSSAETLKVRRPMIINYYLVVGIPLGIIALGIIATYIVLRGNY